MEITSSRYSGGLTAYRAVAAVRKVR